MLELDAEGGTEPKVEASRTRLPLFQAFSRPMKSFNASASGCLSVSLRKECEEHLWDRFELIWGWRISPSRKMLEGFVCCMRERAQLERQYARCAALLGLFGS